MMASTSILPIEFNSTVEFVLVGRIGNERGVLAQSKGANLDLVAYAQEQETPSYLTLLASPIFVSSIPMAVHSPPVSADSSSSHADSRSWLLTFVWRAPGSRRNEVAKEELQESLANHVRDIVDAINAASPSILASAISDLVRICSIHRGRVVHRRRRMLTVLTFYLIALAGAIVVLMLKQLV